MLISLLLVLAANTPSMAADLEVLKGCRQLRSYTGFTETDGDLRAGYVGPFSEFEGLLKALGKESKGCIHASNPKELESARARFKRVHDSAADFLDETKNAPAILRALAVRAEKAGEPVCGAQLEGFAVRVAGAHDALAYALAAASETCRKGVPVLR